MASTVSPVESSSKTKKKVEVKEERVTVGAEMKRGLGYKGGEALMRVFEILSLKHAIFVMAGPIECYSLFFVFWYKCPLLYSWMERRIYPSICNGGEVFSRNVFARYPLKAASKDKGENKMAISNGAEYERVDGDFMDWEDSQGVPRSRHTPTYISRMIWKDETHGDPADYPDAGIFYRTHAEFRRLSDEYAMRMKKDFQDHLNMKPFRGCMTIDMRNRIRRNEIEDLSIRHHNAQQRVAVDEVSLFLEEDTHFFDCHLLPLDMSKLLHVSQIDGDEIIQSLSRLLEEDVKRYPIEFRYWLWSETGGDRYPTPPALPTLTNIPTVSGWDERNESVEDTSIIDEGKVLPLDVILWKRRIYTPLWHYRQYCKSCLKEKVPIDDVKFIRENRVFLFSLPSWYLIHMGVYKLHEIPRDNRNVKEAVVDEKYDYMKTFVERGDVKNVLEVGEYLDNPTLFKLLDCRIRIPYRNIHFMAVSPERRCRSEIQNVLYGSLMDEARAYDPYLVGEGKIRYEVDVVSPDIVNYLVEGSKIQEILPYLEVDLKSGKYSQVSVESRIDYLFGLLEGVNQHKSLKLGQAACVCQVVSEMLDYGDKNKIQIIKEGIVPRPRWLPTMFDYISRLSGVSSDLMGLAATITTVEGVRFILQIGARGELWKMNPAELLPLFIRGWNNSMKDSRTAQRNVGGIPPMRVTVRTFFF